MYGMASIGSKNKGWKQQKPDPSFLKFSLMHFGEIFRISYILRGRNLPISFFNPKPTFLGQKCVRSVEVRPRKKTAHSKELVQRNRIKSKMDVSFSIFHFYYADPIRSKDLLDQNRSFFPLRQF